MSDSLEASSVFANCSSSCTGTLGANIFPDGDFGAGFPNIVPINPNLAPGYIYQLNPPPDDGYYCIANNTTPWGLFAVNAWIDIEDHGPEANGYMMVVNASYQPGLFYQKTVNVCENTLYEFSIDVINLFFSNIPNSILPNITFLVDGNPVCETGDILNDEKWHTSRFSFLTAPGQTTVKLALRNNAPGGNGNDLAIDNISLRACGPGVVLPPMISFCKGMIATIQPTLVDVQNPSLFYQWQQWFNGTWLDVPNGNTINLTISNPADSSLYRLVVANSPGTINEPFCHITSDAVRLQLLPDLLINALSQDVSCSGLSDATATITTTTGIAPWTYTWSSGGNTPLITGLSPGIFGVTVTDSLGCMGITAVTISEPPPMITNGLSTPVSCFGGSNGTASMLTQGGTMPYTWIWSTGQTVSSISGLLAETYSLTVSDAQGCNNIISVSIPEPNLLEAGVLPTDVSCFGGMDGSLSATVIGGTPPYNYAWSNGQTTASAIGLGSGIYTLSVIDANGCPVSVSALESEPSQLLANASSNPASCFGASNGTAFSIISGGMPPYAYAWNNGQTTGTANMLAAGTYFLTVMDAQGCPAYTTIAVSEPPLLALSTTNSPVSCAGGSNAFAQSAISGGTPPYSYIWSNGQTDAMATNLTAGAYLLQVLDANGCAANTSLTITSPDSLTVNINSNPVSCFGGANAVAHAETTGGVLPYSYVWSNGQTNDSALNLSAGLYSLTVMDGNTCSSIATITVTSPSLLTGSITTTDVACFGGMNGFANALVTGGITPYQYLWSNGQTTDTLSNLMAGMYTLTCTDANGCTHSNSITVNQPPALALNIPVVAATCFDLADGMAIGLLSGGVAPYSYTWSNGQTDQQIKQLSAGTYQLTATDAHGCSLEQSAFISQPPPLELSIQTNAVSCNGGANGSAIANLSGGIAPYQLLWSNNQTTTSITGLPAGSYSLNATDQHGCLQTGNVMVDQPGSLQQFMVLQDIACFGGSDGSISINVSGGIAPYTYGWSNGVTSAQITDIPVGSYSVTITDENQCTQTAQASLSQPPLLSSSAENVLAVTCHGGNNGTASVLASGGTLPYQYHWSNGSNSDQVNLLSAGVYWVSLTDANGCLTTTSVEVNEPAPLLLSSISSQPSCPEIADGVLTAVVSGGTMPYTYQWSNGITDAETIGLAAGAYTVTIVDANQCLGTISADLISQDLPQVHLGADLVVNLGEYIDLTAVTNLPANRIKDYSWTGTEDSLRCPDCRQYRFQPTKTGCQQVLLSSVNGCTANDTLCYRVRPYRRVYAPNAFSPNDDGNNDYFTIFSNEAVARILKLAIFNRWGEQVFLAHDIQTNDEPNGWNGSFRGLTLNNAVFVWYAEIEFIDGERILMKGDVTLIR